MSVAPHLYKVVSENDKVRVLDSFMNPGEKTEMHSHPALVAVALTSAKVKFTLSHAQLPSALRSPNPEDRAIP